jgi:acyl phosphate:glycerol-3-phosphate acyltransferase
MIVSLAWPLLLAAGVFGYLLGSLPFGLILTRLAGTADLRGIGSGNIGATNVLRTGRKDLAVATLLLDALKGTAAVLIASSVGPALGIAAGFGAFLGHLFPVWLGFKGGKGVATFLGVTLGLWWPAFLLFAVVWLAVAYATRYSSAAALAASVVAPAALYLAGLPWEGSALAVMALLLWWKHEPNITRLRQGTESRIGQKG